MKYAASRLAVVQPSAWMAVSGMAKALTDEGHDVIEKVVAYEYNSISGKKLQHNDGYNYNTGTH